MFLLVLTALCGTVGFLYYLHYQIERLTTALIVQGTSIQAEIVDRTRHLYSSEIVERAEAAGMVIAQDYSNRKNAIPTPATFAKRLSAVLESERPGLRIRLFSDHPFPGSPAGGPLDEFERQALTAIQRNPVEPYARVEVFEGRASVRLAVADRMEFSCVACHNHHPQSPKRDWKVGDVLGALEIIRPLDSTIAEARSEVHRLVGAATAASILGMGGLGGILILLRRTLVTLHRSEAELKDLFENAPVGITFVGPDGRILRTNREALAMTGYDESDAIGRSIREFCPDEQVAQQILDRLNSGEEIRDFEYQVRCKNGSMLMWTLDANVFREEGRFVRARCFTRDLSYSRMAEKALAERSKLASLTADVGTALTQGTDLRNTLQRCTDVIVGHLDCAFARIWTFNDDDKVLELQASSGLYTHIDGGHARVPLGKFKIGLIASERLPHLTNSVIGDPRVGDQAWAKREGMVAFAGYPLMVEDRLMGVMAMFARQPLSPTTLDSMAAVANAIALGIRRARAEQTLIDDARVLEQTNQALAQANAAVLKASRIKSEFLANMSHEIRTPMTAILGYTDVLIQESFGRKSSLEHLRIVKRNGEHLLQLINDILDISKIESGKLTVESLSVSPLQILADALSLMRVRADEKGLTLDVLCDGPIPERVQTDAMRLRQVLINLIGNAIKFTERGGVRVAARLERAPEPDSMMRFEIRDSGIGMTPEQASHVFEAFVQGDASTARRYGGSGLGLALSKRLAEMLGGTLTFETEHGKGSVFTVSVRTGPLAGIRMIEGPSGAGPWPVDATVAASPVACEGLPEGSLGEFRHARILLAEDGVDNQRLISYLLCQLGAEVTIAENGRVAVEKALSDRFDLIFMDMQMPELDGYEATRILRNHGYSGPIVALTAHAMSGDRDKCIGAGCDDYMAKPIDRVILVETIRRHLCARNKGVSGRAVTERRLTSAGAGP